MGGVILTWVQKRRKQNVVFVVFELVTPEAPQVRCENISLWNNPGATVIPEGWHSAKQTPI